MNFYAAHQSLAVEMDMNLRSGPVDGTAYRPSCWTGDEFFVFFDFDDGSYQLSASDYSGAEVSVSATTPLASGSDPSLVGARSRRLRIECDPAGSATTISGYADGRLVATAQAAMRVDRSFNSNQFAGEPRLLGPPDLPPRSSSTTSAPRTPIATSRAQRIGATITGRPRRRSSTEARTFGPGGDGWNGPSFR